MELGELLGILFVLLVFGYIGYLAYQSLKVTNILQVLAQPCMQFVLLCQRFHCVQSLINFRLAFKRENHPLP